ncbi:oxidoreductase, zinc-binding dehydrogenase family [Verrucomicrobiia bacterium DG1235]|nr:oxidoreductase, zinc-binding dehydrogenase family [Verrucomicrobiae bacterium DG1235]
MRPDSLSAFISTQRVTHSHFESFRKYKIMKAMLLRSYGENSEFEAAEVATPEIKPGHVLVKIAASSVNTVDTMIRNMGKDLPLSPDTPAILGMDFAGTIEALGEGVDAFSVGDEVYGCAGGLADLPGTLAEYIVADANLIARKSQNLSMREAAAIPLVGITAYEGLKRAAIKPGQKVLVHGGSGGVGHLAIQLAKHFGADVYSTGGGEKQKTLIEGFGATFINYKTESVEDYVAKHTDGVGFDLIFDTVGGANMLNSFNAAALNGQIASTVSLCEIDLSVAHFKGLSLHVVFMLIPMLHNHRREDHAYILSELEKIAELGELKPVLDETDFSLEEAGLAHTRLESGQAMGKVVIENRYQELNHE